MPHNPDRSRVMAKNMQLRSICERTRCNEDDERETVISRFSRDPRMTRYGSRIKDTTRLDGVSRRGTFAIKEIHRTRMAGRRNNFLFSRHVLLHLVDIQIFVSWAFTFDGQARMRGKLAAHLV